MLTALFTGSCYFVAKKLFSKTVAYFFTAYVAIYSVFHVNGLYNPHGAMFLMPLFLYTFVRYVETGKLKQLFLNIMLGSFIVEFQLAVGIPLLILTFLYVCYRAVFKKQLKHLVAFAIVPVLLSNFIIFDLRHDFLLTKQATGFASSNTKSTQYEMGTYINDRIRMALISPEIFRTNTGNRNYYAVPIVLLLALYFALQKKHRIFYLSFLYLYLGFFMLSVINKGFLLYFYVFPFFPAVFLVISSFVDTKFKKLAIVFLLVIFAANIQTTFEDLKSSYVFFGQNRLSWKLLNSAAAGAFKGNEGELGYFVFSPDSVAYPEKYAMYYQSKLSDKKSYYFQKKPVTYIFTAPPPENGLGFGSDFWIKQQINIAPEPKWRHDYPAGIQIQRYELTDEEINVPFNAAIDPGLNFR